MDVIYHVQVYISYFLLIINKNNFLNLSGYIHHLSILED
jgi:hypothetical protein